MFKIREALEHRQEMQYHKAIRRAQRKIANGAPTDRAAIKEHKQNTTVYLVLKDLEFILAGANISASIATFINPSSTKVFQDTMASMFPINKDVSDMFLTHPALTLAIIGVIGITVGLYNGHKAMQEHAFAQVAEDYN